MPIQGKPELFVETAKPSEKFAILPTDFEGVKFKVETQEGAIVKVGSPLLSNRANPDMYFTAPAGGKVLEIKRGKQRKLLEVIIEKSDNEEFEEFKSFSAADLKAASADDIQKELLRSGLWMYMIQRPFSRIATASAKPKSIFINAMDTEPNCADKQFLLQGKENFFQLGIEALHKFTEGKVFLCYDGLSENISDAVKNAQGVEIHQFSGAHPAGNVGTHISKLDPISKGDVVWHINADHLAIWGEFFSTGKLPVERTVALGGSQVAKPQYFKTRLGAPLSSILEGNLSEGENRILNGGVFTGKRAEADSFVGYYNATVTVLPEGQGKEFIGWMKPGADKPSFTRLFASALFPNKKFKMDTKINGEPRAIVATHIYDPLVALDVHTVFLVKACLAKDVERMEELGLLECAPEDFSLCTYACVSKLDVNQVIKQGLELLEREG